MVTDEDVAETFFVIANGWDKWQQMHKFSRSNKDVTDNEREKYLKYKAITKKAAEKLSMDELEEWKSYRPEAG